jgi:hypothetical protein
VTRPQEITSAMAMKPEERYVAEWVEKQFFDKDGEWQPDRDENGTSEHGSETAAKRAATQGAKRTKVAGWARVTLERKTVRGEWDEVRTWVGDGEGAWSDAS